MFCVGMFIQPVRAESNEILPNQPGCHGQHRFSGKKSYLSASEASCCYNRPYNSQAIIDGGNFNRHPFCLNWATNSEPGFYLNNFCYHNKSQVNIFSPPEGEALSSIFKKE